MVSGRVSKPVALEAQGDGRAVHVASAQRHGVVAAARSVTAPMVPDAKAAPSMERCTVTVAPAVSACVVASVITKGSVTAVFFLNAPLMASASSRVLLLVLMLMSWSHHSAPAASLNNTTTLSAFISVDERETCRRTAGGRYGRQRGQVGERAAILADLHIASGKRRVGLEQFGIGLVDRRRRTCRRWPSLRVRAYYLRLPKNEDWKKEGRPVA